MTGPALVVFDFDGTLAETRDAVSTVVNAALASHLLPRVDPAVIHDLMGLPLEQLLFRCVPLPDRGRPLEPLVRFYRSRFDRLGAPHARPMPGAVEAVQGLRAAGVRVAIATSRERVSLDPMLDRFGLAGAFDAIATCDTVTRGKPDPEMLHQVLAGLSVAPEDAWMVGDTTYDVEMAIAAGVRSIGVPHGSHTSQRLADAGAELVDDLDTLVRWARA